MTTVPVNDRGKEMAIKVYDLCGADDRRFSPFCWRIRMALAHKGLDAEFEATHFTEKDKIAFADSKTVPVIVDGETAMNDLGISPTTWKISIRKNLPCLAAMPVVRLLALSTRGRIPRSIRP